MNHPCVSEKEYEKTRSVADLFEWIECYRNTIEGSRELRNESIQRREKISRRIYEEAHPIYHYCKRTNVPLSFIVKLHAGNQNFDGTLESTDGSLEYLEVTQALDNKDYLRRKTLVETGCCSLSTLMSYADMTGLLAESANAIIKMKEGKSYPMNTTLILALDDNFNLDAQEIFLAITNSLSFNWNKSTFTRVFVCSHNGNLFKLILRPI